MLYTATARKLVAACGFGFIACLAANIATAGTTSASVGECAKISQQKSMNLPFSSKETGTEIIHGAAVFYDGQFAGALYVTREERVYAQVGLPSILKLAAAQRKAAESLASALGIPSATPGASVANVSSAKLLTLVQPGFETKGCF